MPQDNLTAKQNDYNKAMEFVKKVLKKDKTIYRLNNLLSSNTLHNISIVAETMNNFDKAPLHSMKTF